MPKKTRQVREIGYNTIQKQPKYFPKCSPKYFTKYSHGKKIPKQTKHEIVNTNKLIVNIVNNFSMYKINISGQNLTTLVAFSKLFHNQRRFFEVFSLSATRRFFVFFPEFPWSPTLAPSLCWHNGSNSFGIRIPILEFAWSPTLAPSLCWHNGSNSFGISGHIFSAWFESSERKVMQEKSDEVADRFLRRSSQRLRSSSFGSVQTNAM